MFEPEIYAIMKFCPEAIEAMTQIAVLEELKSIERENNAIIRNWQKRKQPKITIIYGDYMAKKNNIIHVTNRNQYSVDGPLAPEDAIRHIREKFGLPAKGE